MRFNQDFIKATLPESILSGAPLPEQLTFSIDSRTICKGDIFIALEGTTVDGHQFINEALQKGARGIIAHISKKQLIPASTVKESTVILVNNTHEALFKLAAAWRMYFTGPVIGITGSLGKTITKEMLANIFVASGYNALISEGNQNTVIGVSLNILRLRPEHTVAVLEMGVSKRGEMARMVDIVRPTSAIITQIAHSHMEGLGSIYDIANEKRDIFKYFKEDNIGIINGDQPLLAQVAYTHPTVKFGCKTINQIQARKIQSTHDRTAFMLKLYKNRYKVTLPTNHTGRVINALAASAAAHLLGISPELIVQGIQTPLTIFGRFQALTIKDNKGVLINDAYNANPESMKAALLALERVDAKGAKIAVLGDMLELGVNSPFWHRQLGRFLRKVPSLHHVILVGDMVKWTKTTVPLGLTVDIVADWREALDKVRDRLVPDSVILIKASRAVALYNLAGYLTEQKSEQK